MDPFAGALDALARGDRNALAALLDEEPELVRARREGVEPPCDGYFHRPTLLHHVSGNPAVTPVPGAAPELAALLLDRGAEIDALTEAGPSQPTDVGWTTLGLVASGAAVREAGVQLALIDLLVERGADLDAPGGGPLMGALYYGEGASAARLAEHGADVDFVAAAGLGRPDLLERFVGEGGALSEDAHRLVHYSLVPLPSEETREDVLSLALCYAVKGGWIGTGERLLELGADPNRRPPFDHGALPLHWCVLGDEPEAASWLLARGADPDVRDRSHDATPREWAQALGRPGVLAALEPEG